MPEFEEALDAAILAFERGNKPARQASDALFAAYPTQTRARALAVAGRVAVGDIDAAKQIELGDDGPALAARGVLLVGDGDVEAGTRAVERALVLAPDDPIVLGAASGIIGAFDPERALAIARHALALRPHDPGRYALLLGPLAALEHWEEIEALLNDPPSAFAGTARHTRLRVTELRRKGDLRGAQAAAREFVAQVPDSAGAWGLLALLLSQEDQRAEADAAALHALDLNPRQTEALLVLARSAEARGDAVEAARLREERRRASPLAEATKPIHEVRGLFIQGRFAELLEVLARFDDLPPISRPHALRQRIRFLTMLEDDEALRRAVETAPFDDDYTAIGRAEILLRAGRFAEARALIEPRWAERRAPILAPSLLRALGGSDPEAARSLADELIADPPGNVLDALSTLTAMTKAKVMGSRLYPYLNAIERKYPTSQAIREFKALVLLRMGHLDEAERLGKTLDVPRRQRFEPRRARAVMRAFTKGFWIVVKRAFRPKG